MGPNLNEMISISQREYESMKQIYDNIYSGGKKWHIYL